LLEAVSVGPELAPESGFELLKLANELKRPAALMTAGHDRDDIHTVLVVAAHWQDLNTVARRYTARRMRRLYITASSHCSRLLVRLPTSAQSDLASTPVERTRDFPLGSGQGEIAREVPSPS
jgi:hypothetical protein